jgi:hypothetical protein
VSSYQYTGDGSVVLIDALYELLYKLWNDKDSVAQYKRSAFRGFTSKIMVFTGTTSAIKVIFN